MRNVRPRPSSQQDAASASTEPCLLDEDGAVVAAVRAGDTDAFRILVDRHKQRVYAMLMSLTADADAAEELAQETFVRAFSGLGRYRADACFGTWLIQIAIHAARDHRRRSQRERRRSPLSLDEMPEARRNEVEAARQRFTDPSRTLQADEEAAMLHRAIAELPGEYREVLVLKHLEGLSYQAIANLTGDTPGTVKVRAHRARRMLRELLLELDPTRHRGAGPASTSRLAGAMRSDDG